jgi:hypothetical protein
MPEVLEAGCFISGSFRGWRFQKREVSKPRGFRSGRFYRREASEAEVSRVRFY